MEVSTLSKKCLVCGDIFYKRANCSSERWSSSKKYCSVDCQNISKLGSKPWNIGLKYDESMKERLDQSGLARGRGLYKGKKMPQWSGENSHSWKPKIEAECTYCHARLLLVPWQKKKRNFCNRLCWSLGTRGKGSPVFKGEKATKKLRNRIMELSEYNYWRVAVFIRDDHRCVQCGSKKQLEADHMKSFALLVRENEIKNTEDARGCVVLWDVGNGRTLCKECHRKTDTYLKRLKA